MDLGGSHPQARQRRGRPGGATHQAKAKLAGLLGECELRSGHAADAAGHLRLLLDSDEEVPAKVREHAEGLFAEAHKLVGTVELSPSLPTATLAVDGEPLAGKVAYLTPGVHTVTASAEGYPEKSVKVTARAGERQVVAIALAKAGEQGPDDGPKPPPPDGGAEPWVVGIGATLTVAAIASGIGLRVAAGGKEDDAAALEEQTLAAGGCSGICQDVYTAYEDADGLYNASTGLLVTGGVLGVATILYAIVALPGDSDSWAAGIPLPVLAPGFAGALLTRSF